MVVSSSIISAAAYAAAVYAEAVAASIAAAAVPKDLVPHSSRRVKGERYIYSGRPEWIDMGPVNEIVNEALQKRKRRDSSADSRP